MSSSRGDSIWDRWASVTLNVKPPVARPRRAPSRAALPAGMATVGVLAIAAALVGSHFLSIGPAASESPEASQSSTATRLLGSGKFVPTGSMTTARMGHTATLLQDGRVLLAGGEDDNLTCLSSAELYDPKTGKFSRTGSMVEPRASHTATLLHNGLVLISGGFGNG
ncbi:MAG: kelch repeat-containing protein, partial [Candidatus Limnocylindrales bacterium]